MSVCHRQLPSSDTLLCITDRICSMDERLGDDHALRCHDNLRCDVNACLPPTCADYLPIDRYARLIDVCLQHKHDQSGLIERLHLAVAIFSFNFYAVVRLALHHGVVAHFHRCSTDDGFILNLVTNKMKPKKTKQNYLKQEILCIFLKFANRIKIVK